MARSRQRPMVVDNDQEFLTKTIFALHRAGYQ